MSESAIARVGILRHCHATRSQTPGPTGGAPIYTQSLRQEAFDVRHEGFELVVVHPVAGVLDDHRLVAGEGGQGALSAVSNR